MHNNYNECKSTAFISFSNADSNRSASGWVPKFDIEFTKKLEAELDELEERVKENSMYLKTPVQSGELEQELKTKILESFVMIVIVGDNYLKSTLCINECNFFVNHIDKESIKKRLFILPITEASMDTLKDDWKILGIDYEPAFIPFFSEHKKSFPINLFLENGESNGVLNPVFENKLDNLVAGVAKLINESQSSSDLPESPTHEQSPQINSPKILIGVTTTDLIQQSEDLKDILLGNGFDVTLFSKENLNCTSDELSQKYEKYSYLILIYSRCKPEMRFVGAGGHLKFQHDTWPSTDKILWLSNTESEISGNNLARGKDLDYIKSIDELDNSFSTIDILSRKLNQLINPPTHDSNESNGIFKFFIEKNKRELSEYLYITSQIEEVWDEISEEIPNVPKLEIEPFDIDYVNTKEFKVEIEDFNAIIILWGQRSEDSIKEQATNLKKIFSEVNFPAHGSYALSPRLIAFLSPPNKKNIPSAQFGWNIFQFDKNPVWIWSVNNTSELEEILQRFKSKFLSKPRKCTILIVNVINVPDQWTIAGFNDQGCFKDILINDAENELSVELKKDQIDKSRVVELATSKLGCNQKPISGFELDEDQKGALKETLQAYIKQYNSN